jgi:hypothetical protein
MRRLLLPLLGLALLAQTAVAQTTPKKPTRPATKTTRPAASARRNADPLAGTNDGGKGQSGYAAPGEPIQDPRYNGKNTPPYDGGTAPAKRNTTLSTPK